MNKSIQELVNVLSQPQKGHSAFKHYNHNLLDAKLSPRELNKLYQSIETLVPDKTSRIIQFISAYHAEDAHRIAFAFADTAANQMGKKVLFIDTFDTQNMTHHKLYDAIEAPLDLLLYNDLPLFGGIVSLGNAYMLYSIMGGRDNHGKSFANVEFVGDLMQAIYGQFDYIVINSPDYLSSIFSHAFSQLAHGSVMVVEAESTRAPVVLQIQHSLLSSGGRLIGSILNKRRIYIPHKLYDFFYRQK